MSALLRKYGVATTIPFSLLKVDGIDFETAATFAAGDVKVMKDEGAEANITTLPSDEGQGYSLALSATEMQAARIVVYIVDSVTKVWLDIAIVINTYGNASAQHAFDLDTALVTLAAATHTGAVIPTVSVLTTLPTIPANWLTATGIAASALNGKGNWNIGKTGYSISGTITTLDGLQNISATDIVSAGAITTLSGAVVNVGNNADMRGTDGANTVTPPTVGAIQSGLATSVDLAAVKAETALIIADTNELQVDWEDGGRLDLLLDQIITDIAALNNLSAAQINAEVADVLNTDALAELAAVPGANASISAKINWLFLLNKNKATQTATTKTIRNDADSADIATSAVSSDGTIFTRQEWS